MLYSIYSRTLIKRRERNHPLSTPFDDATVDNVFCSITKFTAFTLLSFINVCLCLIMTFSLYHC